MRSLIQRFHFSDKEKKIVYGIAVVFGVIAIIYTYTCLTEKVCGVDSVNRFVRHDVTLTLPKGAIVAEVVDTKSSRELGLSGRKELRINEGMLFVFDVDGRYGFWMKDMLFPIDIAWINQNGIVVKTETNLTPESYPKTFINDSDARYVLELPNGSLERYGVYLGSSVRIGE